MTDSSKGQRLSNIFGGFLIISVKITCYGPVVWLPFMLLAIITKSTNHLKMCYFFGTVANWTSVIWLVFAAITVMAYASLLVTWCMRSLFGDPPYHHEIIDPTKREPLAKTYQKSLDDSKDVS
jgi:hypothetical protein